MKQPGLYPSKSKYSRMQLKALSRVVASRSRQLYASISGGSKAEWKVTAMLPASGASSLGFCLASAIASVRPSTAFALTFTPLKPLHFVEKSPNYKSPGSINEIVGFLACISTQLLLKSR